MIDCFLMPTYLSQDGKRALQIQYNEFVARRDPNQKGYVLAYYEMFQCVQ